MAKTNQPQGDIDEAYLKGLDVEYNADLQQQRRNRRIRWLYSFIRFWAAMFLVVEIGFVILQIINKNQRIFGLDRWETWAMIAIAVIFIGVFFVADSMRS